MVGVVAAHRLFRGLLLSSGAVRIFDPTTAPNHAPGTDLLVATSHWLYMTLRRLGRDDEARQVLKPIHADMYIIENHSYHRLLLM